MTDKYNGWTNYATWRINLELFDDPWNMFEDYGGEVTPDILKDMAWDAITGYGDIPEDSLAVSYADAFLNDVNWWEIADAINETLTQDEEENA